MIQQHEKEFLMQDLLGTKLFQNKNMLSNKILLETSKGELGHEL
jgi:hypothetical protein